LDTPLNVLSETCVQWNFKDLHVLTGRYILMAGVEI